MLTRRGVAIVNEAFARKMFGNEPAVGRHFLLWNDLYEVVGVAGNGKYLDLNEPPSCASLYLYRADGAEQHGACGALEAASRALAGDLQRVISSIAPTAPITIRSWPDALSNVLFPGAGGDGRAGGDGTAGGDAGGHRHLRHGCVQREPAHEGVGHPRGLGRAQERVISAALGRPFVLLGVGSAVGLLSGVFASQLLGQIVYQANPSDPVVVGGAVLMMALLGVVAAAIPARRALAVDPSRLVRRGVS